MIACFSCGLSGVNLKEGIEVGELHGALSIKQLLSYGIKLIVGGQNYTRSQTVILPIIQAVARHHSREASETYANSYHAREARTASSLYRYNIG